MDWSPQTKGECQRCGFKYELRALRKEWTGLRVCDSCRDPKPEAFTPLRPPKGEGAPKRESSPESEPIFITPGVNDIRPEDL